MIWDGEGRFFYTWFGDLLRPRAYGYASGLWLVIWLERKDLYYGMNGGLFICIYTLIILFFFLIDFYTPFCVFLID